MKAPKRLALLLCLSAFPLVAAGALLVFLLGAPGTKGLLEWNPSYLGVVYLIAAAGLLPCLALAVSALLGRKRQGRASRVAESVLVALAALAGASLCAALVYLAASGSSSPVSGKDLLHLGEMDARTWGSEGRPIRLAFSSDAHFGAADSRPDATAAIISRVDSGGYDAFFVLGDLTTLGSVDGDLRAAHGAFLAEKKVPLAFLVGNHDSLVAAEPRYMKAFGIGSPSFRYDSGDLHLIALDLLWGAEDWSAAKAAALEAALAAIPAEDAVIVVSHCFFWSSGYVDAGTGKPWFDHYGTTLKIAPLLEKYRVDLVVSGHNHYMEYLEKDATSYAVVGALGGLPDPVPSHLSPYSKWFSRGVYGYLEAELSGGELRMRFIDQAGKILFERRKAVNR